MFSKEIFTSILGIGFVNIGLFGMYFAPNTVSKLDTTMDTSYTLPLAVTSNKLSSLTELYNQAQAQSGKISKNATIVTTGAKEQVKASTVKTAFPAVPNVSVIDKFQKPKPSPQLNISKIGLNNIALGYGSATVAGQVENQLLYKPVVESKITANLCSNSSNAYIYGHSEPSVASTRGYPGVYIFSELNKLVAGDKIQVTSNLGISCNYTVTGWDQVVTDSENRVSEDDFNKTFYPATNGQGMLTIQTCKKGSSTVRLLLRAKLEM